MRLKPAPRGEAIMCLKLAAVFPTVVVIAALFAAPVQAKLPPPSADQQAAAAQKKAEEAAKAREQQEALTRVQDRIAAKFGRHGSVAGGGKTAKEDLPKKAVEPMGAAGPSGGREQSAEAHSTPAR